MANRDVGSWDFYPVSASLFGKGTMATIQVEIQSLQAAIQDLNLEKEKLLSKTKQVIAKTEDLIKRIQRERPESIVVMAPVLEQLRAIMASMQQQTN